MTLTEESFTRGDIGPDFSENGSPIQFGYFRSNSAFSTNYSITGGVDNWTVNVVAVPEPATLLIFALGSIYLNRKKR